MAETEEGLRRMYLDQKMTASEIAAVLGCNKDRVYYLLRKEGIPRRRQGEGRRPANYKDVDLRALRRLYVDEGLSSHRAASAVGLSQRQAYLRLKAMGAIDPDRHPIAEPITPGSRRRTSDGYWAVYQPDDPHATRSGWALEHRIVMACKLGRILRPQEVVHHKNEDRLDNRPDNLALHANPGIHVATEHPRGKQYTDEEMLQHLRDLSIRAGRSPTLGDAERAEDGPSASLYYLRFGSFTRARTLAGL